MNNNLKSLFLNWIDKNKILIKDSSINEDEIEIVLSIKPQKIGTSQIDLRISKSTPEVDIGAGVYFSVSDFNFESVESLLEILDAIRDGKIEEKVFSFCGVKLKTEGQIVTNTKTIFSKNIKLLGLGFLLPKSINKLDYKPW